MPTDNITPSRSYEEPHSTNDLEYDVARLINGVRAIDLDVATLFAGLAGKADTSHGHGIVDITGLQTALDGKASASHGHTLNALSDVSAAAPGTNHVLHYNGSSYQVSAIQGEWIAGGTIAAARLASYLQDGEVVQTSKSAAQSVAGNFTAVGQLNTQGGEVNVWAAGAGQNSHVWFRDQSGNICGLVYNDDPDASGNIRIRRYLTGGAVDGEIVIYNAGSQGVHLNGWPALTEANYTDLIKRQKTHILSSDSLLDRATFAGSMVWLNKGSSQTITFDSSWGDGDRVEFVNNQDGFARIITQPTGKTMRSKPNTTGTRNMVTDRQSVCAVTFRSTTECSIFGDLE